MRLSVDPFPGVSIMQPEGRSEVDDACPSLQKPDRYLHGGPGGEREEHEVRRFDILQAHKVEASVIEIGMDLLDRSGRSASDPRDVRLRMAQQDTQRFTAHVATPTDNPHTYHSVLSLIISYKRCLLPAIMLAVRRTLALTCCRKPQRGRSGRWRQSGAVPDCVKTLADGLFLLHATVRLPRPRSAFLWSCGNAASAIAREPPPS